MTTSRLRRVFEFIRSFCHPRLESSDVIQKPDGSAGLQYLYLTTIGPITGQPREIEIWFVEFEAKLFILAEHFHDAHWMRNIQRNPRVHVRLGTRQFDATARVLNRERDEAIWLTTQRLAREKYGWGDGLPVEIVGD